jgi:hypothetical protein
MDHQSTLLSSEIGCFGKLKFKKREMTGQSEGVVRDFQDRPRDTGQVRRSNRARAYQHKLHFTEVDGLRRDQPGRIFLKNDRLALSRGQVIPGRVIRQPPPAVLIR